MQFPLSTSDLLAWLKLEAMPAVPDQIYHAISHRRVATPARDASFRFKFSEANAREILAYLQRVSKSASSVQQRELVGAGSKA